MIGKYLDTLKAQANPASGLSPEGYLMQLMLKFLATGESPEISHLLALATADGDQEAIDFFTDVLASGEADHANANGDVHSDGSVAYTADQSMGGHKLTNIAAPSASGDAARKADSDAALSAGNTGITNAAIAQSAANTAQTTANAALPKAGGTMTGTIAMGTNGITGLADPTNAQDASTKNYVDSDGSMVEILLTYSGTHSHSAVLTVEDVQSLVEGEVASVVVTSTSDLGHTHSVTVTWDGVNFQGTIAGNHSHTFQTPCNGTRLPERASAPANPPAGWSVLYFKTDHKLYRLDSDGNEVLVG